GDLPSALLVLADAQYTGLLLLPQHQFSYTWLSQLPFPASVLLLILIQPLFKPLHKLGQLRGSSCDIAFGGFTALVKQGGQNIVRYSWLSSQNVGNQRSCLSCVEADTEEQPRKTRGHSLRFFMDGVLSDRLEQDCMLYV